MAVRLQAMGKVRYASAFRLVTHADALAVPVGWRQPRHVFVNSMSDLFHERVPASFIAQVFDVMNRCPQHTFQVLTKRAERAAALAPILKWTPNIWMGISVENCGVIGRIEHLITIPANIRFLSAEPLLGPLRDLPLNRIHWVIVGGESGPGAREMKPDWARDVRDRCIALKVPFFFKQWGGINKKRAGRELDGRLWNEMPVLI